MTKPIRRPTIIDVANAAGVAPSTVSHALNGKGYVDKKTKARILKSVKELGYRPNLRARGLRTGGPRIIALISGMPLGVSGGTSRLGFLMEIASVAAEEAMRRGLSLVLCPPQAHSEEQPQLEVDGAIVVEPRADAPQLAWLSDTALPVVSLGRWPGREDLPYVDLLSEETAVMLLDHLQSCGCKNIALLIGDNVRTSYLETEKAYKAFCAVTGQPEHIRKLAEAGGELAGQAATADLLQKYPEVDGLLALVDAFATGALKAAHSMRIQVPEQLKLATRYDGLRAKLCKPALTSVDLHLQEVASLGVELLFQQLLGKESAPRLWPQRPHLVVRGSTVAGAGEPEPMDFSAV